MIRHNRKPGDEEREMEHTCEGKTVEQSTFTGLNDALQSISDDLKEITKSIAGYLDRLVGVATERPKAEGKPVLSPSGLGLVGALSDQVGMLQRRVLELREQLSRVDGKF